MPADVTVDHVVVALAKIVAAKNAADDATTGACRFQVDGQPKCIPGVTKEDCAQISGA